MAVKGWRSKGDKVLRRSPRKKGKTCGRPFSARRKVSETTPKTPKIVDPKEVRVLTDSEVQMITSVDEAVPEIEDSDLMIITESEKGRQIDAQQDKAQQDKLQQDTLEETTPVIAESDTTESTPDIFRSPVREVVQTSQRSPDKETSIEVVDTRQRRGFQYVGTTHVAETEQQDNTSTVTTI